MRASFRQAARDEEQRPVYRGGVSRAGGQRGPVLEGSLALGPLLYPSKLICNHICFERGTIRITADAWEKLLAVPAERNSSPTSKAPFACARARAQTFSCRSGLCRETRTGTHSLIFFFFFGVIFFFFSPNRTVVLIVLSGHCGGDSKGQRGRVAGQARAALNENWVTCDQASY